MMNNDFFRKEMHQYIDEQYTEFEKYQQDVISALSEFDRICRKNNIIYYLGFGALLGVYRDGAILPWDYDVDVIVPIYEKEKLIKALTYELSKEFYFYCPEIDKKCRHYCIRITKTGFDSAAIHMDVFYLIGAPEDNFKREKFRKKVKWINFARKIKLVDCKKESMGVKAFYYADMLKKMMYFFCPIFLLNVAEKRICKKYSVVDSHYVTVMQAAADTYTNDIFESPSEVFIGKQSYYAPTSIVDFLNQTYRDYTMYPPIQSRFDEFYQMIRKLKYFYPDEKIHSKMDFQINKY